MDVSNASTPEMRPKARRILQDIAMNTDLALDERVLAWAKLKAWGQGQEYACCRVGDLQAPRANRRELDCWREEDIPAAKARLVAASQAQCAHDLKMPVGRIRAAAARLVKRGLLTTPLVQSHQWVTKHKLGMGFRARLAYMWVRAFCPVREVEQ